jgi:hypothetical protein
LLLRLEERLLLLLPRLEPRALARSLCARLFWLLACAPLRPASLRLMVLPREDEEDLEREDEEELRDAIACSLVVAARAPMRWPPVSI